jgi:transcriptional regulator with XRE-family HTH domain
MNETTRTELDLDKLATLTRGKRGNRNLREVAAEIGDVSPSTLSRVENAKTPDMETFLRLCDWLEVPPAELFRRSSADSADEGEKPMVRDRITLQLRADDSLDPATADILAALVSAAYDRFGRKPDTGGE